MSNSICSCLSDLKNPGYIEHMKCVDYAVEENEILIAKAAAELSDTSKDGGYKFGRALYDKIGVTMVFSCVAYFRVMENLRNESINILNQDSLSQTLNTINKIPPQKREKDFNIQKGLLHFQLRQLDSAVLCFDDAIKKAPNSIQAIFFKAWALEILQEYDAAITLYNKLSTLSSKNEFKIFAAMARRKKELKGL